MKELNKVVWYEGMFLQAQHFQQQDRYFENQLKKNLQLTQDNAYGFSHLELDHELQSLGKIGIKSARGIFPDGSQFDLPNIDECPIPYNLSEKSKARTLYLAIPLCQAGNPDTSAQQSDAITRYKAHEYDIIDAIIDSEQSTPMQLGRLACRILSDLDDLSQYACLAIAEVEEIGANHQIKLNPRFIPSCLTIHVSSSLKNLITEVHGLLNHRGQMLADRLTDSQTTGTAEVVDFVLLQTINRYEPIFNHLRHKKTIHPETLYQLLLQVLGEMATFTDEKRRPQDMPIYAHDAIFKSYQPVIIAVRHALSMVLEQNAVTIPLEAREQGLFVGKLHDKNLLSCRFVLAAYSDVSHEQLRPSLPKQIKISPVEQIATLVKRNLPGIPIQAMSTVPRQIPYHNNFIYFDLATSHNLWQSLAKSAGIAIHISAPFPGLKLELWAIRG